MLRAPTGLIEVGTSEAARAVTVLDGRVVSDFRRDVVAGERGRTP